MLPVITLVGHPNVGKSTLFNYLTKTRQALVADLPGLTRDRQYGEGVIGNRPYIVVDTGGIVEQDDSGISQLTHQQVQEAIDEADRILWMVDAQVGLTAADMDMAKRMRVYQEKLIIVINKAESDKSVLMSYEFSQLGFEVSYTISAKYGRGVKAMMQSCLADLPEVAELEDEQPGIRVAVMGRPNVDKSTLINRILGEERVLVFDEPGTTRDSIYIPFERRGQVYTLIDTAGIRRRARVKQVIEKFSAIKALQALQKAHIVIVVIDAQDSISDQDLRIISYVVAKGKGLILAFNKWDSMSAYDREQFQQAVDRRLVFASFARRYFISALHGTGVGKLYFAINEAYQSAEQTFSTSSLTKMLQKAMESHQPPLVRGRRIRLRYAHLGGHHPMVFVIHGKQTKSIPGSYQQYLTNYFRKQFNLVGIPLLLQFKSDANPYVTS